VAIQEDGKILVGGEAGDSGETNWDFALARLKSGGALDTTFSSDGRVLTDFDDHYDGIWDMVLQPDGKLVAGGWAQVSTGDNYRFALARYKTGGGLDTTFSGDGKLTADLDPVENDYVEGVELRSDGRIVADGYVNTGGSDPSIGLIRVKTGGGLDTAFSGDGKLVTDPLGADSVYVRDLDLAGGDKLIVSGATSLSQAFVARFKPGGALDAAFGGGDGYVLISIPGTTSTSLNRTTLQPNGRILVTGPAIAGDTEFGVTRLLP